jgi:hypothetical protein
MIAWIIGIVFLLIISLLMSDEYIEPFQYKPPTVVPTSVRSDLTCSDPQASAVFDRYDNAGMESLGSKLMIPPIAQNNALADPNPTDGTPYGINPGELNTGRPTWIQACEGGTMVFIQKNERYNFLWQGITHNFNYVDLYCCKGEMVQPPETVGNDKKICLPLCPTNYTKSAQDETLCIRNDNNCSYTTDLSANIQNNWSKTCAALYRQNINIASTIKSISSVVSTFTKQTETIKNSYDSLNSHLTAYITPRRGSSDPQITCNINNYDTNFGNITSEYNKLNTDIQGNIIQRYNTLEADKVKFNTLFNNLACSNFM